MLYANPLAVVYLLPPEAGQETADDVPLVTAWPTTDWNWAIAKRERVRNFILRVVEIEFRKDCMIK
jgi:hypothetical protein